MKALTEPLPDTPRFNRALQELQSAFILWAMQQPWADQLKPLVILTVSAPVVAAGAG